MIRRAIKYSVITVSTLAAGSSIYAYQKHGDLDGVGIVRLGRAGKMVLDVANIYNKNLFYKEWDKNSEEYKIQKSKVHVMASNRLLDLILLNKGIYIKVGQHIGGLDYILPQEFVQTMKVLHANAPTNPIEDLYKVIEEDLNTKIEDIFETFEQEPLVNIFVQGTASLAQVHKATLKNGDVVAVKVQHPYVKQHSAIDMKTIELLVKVMSVIFPEFEIQWLVDESKKNIPIELDFLNEGKNAEKVAQQFKNFKWLKIPKIYWELSSPRLLVMEFEPGAQITDLKFIQKHNLNPFDISHKVGHLYAEMIFTNGFVHSDPHPGNILIRPSPNGKEAYIILLDHGLYADLTDHFRFNYSNLWLSILNVNLPKMEKHANNLGIKGDLWRIFVCMVSGRSWTSVNTGINKIKVTDKEKDLIQTESPKALPQIADVLEHVDRQMLLIFKTNDLIRGIETTLKTYNRKGAFWIMSRCCIKSSYDELRRTPEYNNKWFKTRILNSFEKWELFKLNLYYLILGLINFEFISVLREIIAQ